MSEQSESQLDKIMRDHFYTIVLLLFIIVIGSIWLLVQLGFDLLPFN